jgi:outer membrane immunogenic protein
MKPLIAAFAATAIGLVASPALAQAYGNIGYTNVDAGSENFDSVTGRLGWQFASPLAVEAEATAGIGDEAVSVTPPVNAKLKYAAAAYGVARVPVTPNVNILGRVGYGVQQIDVYGLGGAASGTEDSINYGAGVEFNFDAQNGIRADYTRHDFRDSGLGEADAWSVAFARKF